jgi:hypothetical protein
MNQTIKFFRRPEEEQIQDLPTRHLCHNLKNPKPAVICRNGPTNVRSVPGASHKRHPARLSSLHILHILANHILALPTLENFSKNTVAKPRATF